MKCGLNESLFQTRACEYVPSSPLLFAAAQCLGYRNENGVASAEICMPSKSTIIRQIKKAVNKVRHFY
jgi:peptide-O-fucosyltransferase